MDIEAAIESASLAVVVPESSNLDVQQHLRVTDRDEPDSVTLSSVPQRDILYFGRSSMHNGSGSTILLIRRTITDEKISVYLILQCSYTKESEILIFINRLSITLEVLAFSPHPKPDHGHSQPEHSAPSPNQDIIWSGFADGAQKPIIRVLDRFPALAIWRVSVVLSRSRFLKDACSS